MPEGPEIRRSADQLAEVLRGRVIEELYVGLDDLESHADAILGNRVVDVTCHGKALLTHFSSGVTLYSHNQLYGVWRIVRRNRIQRTRRQLRIALHTQCHSALLYSATDVAIWETARLGEHPFLAKLGPDVLDPALTADMVAERLTDPAFARRSLAQLYLDQRFIAGIGNYLRTEILHAAGLSPLARPADLTAGERCRLAVQTLAISQRSYQSGGVASDAARYRTLRAAGEPREKARFLAFEREADPCYRCGTAIVREVTASRRIYWCPSCQAH